MISFKQYLREYLTPEQKTKLKMHEMSPKARADTDHFFGKGNDKVVEDVKNYDHDKSEIHRAVEQHIGKPLSVEEYKSGLHTDKHGRQSKIGKQIKDKTLLDSFANDSTRKGLGNIKKPTVSIHRGTEVAGQTNSAPNELHPTGHSWGEESCKNVDTGGNRHYLPAEVKHGSVIMFAHDHDGKEIYRANLNPHHNDEGHVAYALESEYGLKHPAFTAHAHDVAKRLSGEHKGGSLAYKKHPDVYNDSGIRERLHPSISNDDIDKIVNTKGHPLHAMIVNHPDLSSEHLHALIKNASNANVKEALKHPKIDASHLTAAMADETGPGVKFAALGHKKVEASHIDKGLNNSNSEIRLKAIQHPNANASHITKALKDLDPRIAAHAVSGARHDVTSDHINTALDHPSHIVRRDAILHPNATGEHINKALKDPHSGVRFSAILHPNATGEHIDKALNDSNSEIRLKAIQHPNANASNIAKALKDPDPRVVAKAKLKLENNQ